MHTDGLGQPEQRAASPSCAWEQLARSAWHRRPRLDPSPLAAGCVVPYQPRGSASTTAWDCGTVTCQPEGPGEPGLWSNRAVGPENLLVKDSCPPAVGIPSLAAITSQIQLPSQVDVRSKTCAVTSLSERPQTKVQQLLCPSLHSLHSRLNHLLPFKRGTSL